jgi:hypothetical protein
MSTPGGTQPSERIAVNIGKSGNRYDAPNGIVERIGGKKRRVVIWRFRNTTQDRISVRVCDFRHKPSSGPCPQEGPTSQPVVFSGSDTIHLEPTTTHGHPDEKPVHAKMLTPGHYCYDIEVLNLENSTGNKIDPELQIDDMHFFHQLIQSPIAMAVAAAVLAALAYWFFG